MPFFPLAQPSGDISIGLWHIEEDEEYFLSRLNIYDNEQVILNSITHPAKRLEWLSSRLCLKELLDIRHKVESLNELTGQPYLSDRSFHISYSHSGTWSGAMASIWKRVSLDMEDLRKARNTATSRLFMHPTELEWMGSVADVRIFYLIWSCKETLYKIHGQRGLIFKENLIIHPADSLNPDGGTLQGSIFENGHETKYIIGYRFVSEILVTFTFDDGTHGVRGI